MFRRWTFPQRLAAGYGSVGLVFLVISAIAYRTTSGFIENDTQVAHSYDVRAEFRTLLSELTDAESGLRGYLLTGEESFLQPYRATLDQIRTTTISLQQLTAGNSAQQHSLQEIPVKNPHLSMPWVKHMKKLVLSP